MLIYELCNSSSLSKNNLELAMGNSWRGQVRNPTFFDNRKDLSLVGNGDIPGTDRFVNRLANESISNESFGGRRHIRIFDDALRVAPPSCYTPWLAAVGHTGG
jgi:hypothetical protein